MTNPIQRKQELVTNHLAEIGRAMAGDIPPDRLRSIVFHALRANDRLATCDEASFMDAVMRCARLGMMPDGVEAAIVPYGNEATFVPMYKGIMKKARESGDVADIYAEVVYENDHLEWEKGLEPRLVHRPAKDLAKRGAPKAFYAVARFRDGRTPLFDVMSEGEVQAIKARARAKKGPWQSDYGEMGKKTVVKRLAKYLPINDELRNALDADDALDARMAEVVDDGAKRPDSVESLLEAHSGPVADPEPDGPDGPDDPDDWADAREDDAAALLGGAEPELEPLDPANPAAFKDRLALPAIIERPWDEWAEEHPWGGQLSKYTPKEAIQGSKGGGRHAMLKSIVDYCRSKGPESTPEKGLMADYCLAYMLEKWERGA